MPAGIRTTGNTLTGNLERPRLVDSLIQIMSPEETPLVKLFGVDGEESDNPKREWVMDELAKETSLVTDNPLAQAAVTLNVTAGDGIHFQVGNILKLENEYVWVSAVSTDALTIVRGAFGGGADALHAQGTVVQIVGVAAFEDSDTPLKGTTLPTFAYNLHQVYDAGIKMSLRQQNTPLYGIAQDWNYQIDKALKEAAVKLENNLILGLRSAGSGTSYPPTMGGIDQFIATSAINLSSAALEEKDLLDALQTLYYRVGIQNMGKLVICGSWVKRKVASWYGPNFRFTQNTRKGGVVVDSIQTDFGTIDFLMAARCPVGTAYIVKPEFIKIHPYKGGRFQERPLAVSGPYEKREIYGDYTVVVKNEKAMAKIYGISTST